MYKLGQDRSERSNEFDFVLFVKQRSIMRKVPSALFRVMTKIRSNDRVRTKGAVVGSKLHK